MPSDEANEFNMSAGTCACLPCDASQLINSLCCRNALEPHQCVADQLLKLRCSA
ncbi:hypothetical protein RchiOBHm_Chr1g0364571 [Rosa chinensis]|uniref:Uncharacterized protein n=1 Tax=Rosa chinensis TaxID=74649 RepID=A0A2P6SJQ9_ROSCH|nr:hypothetical protein RchiOBHm_Chr1g0364571 [Rosa chinensis]